MLGILHKPNTKGDAMQTNQHFCLLLHASHYAMLLLLLLLWRQQV